MRLSIKSSSHILRPSCFIFPFFSVYRKLCPFYGKAVNFVYQIELKHIEQTKSVITEKTPGNDCSLDPLFFFFVKPLKEKRSWPVFNLFPVILNRFSNTPLCTTMRIKQNKSLILRLLTALYFLPISFSSFKESPRRNFRPFRLL